MFACQVGALYVGQLVPFGVGLQLRLLLLEGLVECLQLGVERLAQQVHRFVEQGAHGVWLGEQASLGCNGIHFGL